MPPTGGFSSICLNGRWTSPLRLRWALSTCLYRGYTIYFSCLLFIWYWVVGGTSPWEMRTIFLAAVLTQANMISRSSPPKGVPVCYFPNHEIAPNNYACDLSSKVSFCCGIDAICLDNKICLNTVNEHIRGACTDKTWRSPDCPQYCTGLLIEPVAISNGSLADLID